MGGNGLLGIQEWMREEIQPRSLLPSLFTGVIVGITETIFAISLVSLVFSGQPASDFRYGIGMALVTASVMLIVTALLSSVPAVMGSTQDSSSVILAVIAGGLASTLATAGAQARLLTVLVAIGCTTLFTGIFFVVLGLFKLGGLVRFIPYPVIGGFLAGTGWLLAQGSFGVMTTFPLTVGNARELLRPDQLLLWIPAVLVALALLLGPRRIRHSMAMPAILLGTIVLFYLALLVTGMSIQDATRRGLLLGSTSADAALCRFVVQNLLAANWSAILMQSGKIAVTLMLCIVSLLLNARRWSWPLDGMLTLIAS